MKSVGIIGGLGPETTSEFYLDVMFTCQKLDNKQRPLVLISSVPLPTQIEQDSILRNKGVELNLPYLITEARRLEASGADFIVMPCNSLHIFIDELRQSVNVPVLSIIEETVNYIKSKGSKRVGAISTAMTVKNKLYENEFQRNEISFFSPNESEQTKLDKIILNLVNGEKNKEDYTTLINILSNLSDKNIDCAILACTDLQLFNPKVPGLEIVDTMKVFADATVNYILGRSIFQN